VASHDRVLAAAPTITALTTACPGPGSRSRRAAAALPRR